MKRDALKFASLFSGCGGFDLGFIQHGFQPQGAYDCDPEAVDNFRNNILGDIHNVDLTNGIPNEHSLYGIDALIAGPPCQGFSTAGKRQLNDERNQLLLLTGYLATRIKPKVLVVENVKGVLSGKHANYWNRLDKMMRSAGYYTKTLKCIASDFGLAQSRERVLLFAWRTKRDIDFIFPKSHPENLRSVLSSLKNKRNHNPKILCPESREWKIAQKILPGQKLSNVRGGKNVVATWDIPEVFGAVTNKERTLLTALRSLRRQERQRDYGDADPVSLTRLESRLGGNNRRLIDRLVSKGYLRYVGEKIDLVGTFNGKFRRLAWDKPSCTVDTRFGSPRFFLHPSKQRGFTVREAARIQGFDDNYIFSGTERGQFRVIGNAVPPPIGAMAAIFTKCLLGKSS